MVIWNLDWSAAPEETVRQFRTDQEMQALHFGGNTQELLTRDVRGYMALWDLMCRTSLRKRPSHAPPRPSLERNLCGWSVDGQ